MAFKARFKNLGREYLAAIEGAIAHALYYFCGYTAMSPEVKALYALRNRLVHAAFLTSTDQGSGSRYIFRYGYQMSDIVVMPTAAWDGQVSTVRREVVTVIYPRRFTDQVSATIDRAMDLFFHQHDKIRIKKSKDYITINHLFWTANYQVPEQLFRRGAPSPSTGKS